MFTKVSLDSEQISELGLSSYGISENRIPNPKKNWDFAVSEDGAFYFTQLISSTGEMRDGLYWYLYFSGKHYCLITVDAWGGIQIDGRYHCKARLLENEFCETNTVQELKKQMNQAMIVVSHNNDGITFSN